MNGLFPDAPIPLEAMLACVDRELGFRHPVYKRRVAEGRMKQEKADQEIEAMTAVRDVLRAIAMPQNRDRTVGDLFRDALTAPQRPGDIPSDEDPF